MKQCGVDNLLLRSEDHFVLNADVGNWPMDGFCMVYDDLDLIAESYEVSVDLYNQRIGSDQFNGHLGIMYNVQDEHNFDYVYIR